MESYKVSNDPNFADKLAAVVGLYLDPPQNALVLCVDEKSRIQARLQTQRHHHSIRRLEHRQWRGDAHLPGTSPASGMAQLPAPYQTPESGSSTDPFDGMRTSKLSITHNSLKPKTICRGTTGDLTGGKRRSDWH